MFLLCCFSAAQWATAIQRQDLAHLAPSYLHRNGVVCSEHFHQTAFLNDLHNRLKPSAIPTVNIPGSTTASTQLSDANCLQPCKRMKVTSHSPYSSGRSTKTTILNRIFLEYLPASTKI